MKIMQKKKKNQAGGKYFLEHCMYALLMIGLCTGVWGRNLRFTWLTDSYLFQVMLWSNSKVL